jgi:putative chitinase
MPVDQHAEGASARSRAGNTAGAAAPASNPEAAPQPVARPEGAQQPPPVPRPAILLAADTFRQFVPRARPELIAVIADAGNEILTRFGINATTDRLCHFLAQVSHECAGFTVLEENLNYSATRMVQVFGPGRHSARITEAEARSLAGNKQAFAERIYGLGNPTMARRLGNTQPGDGYRYRGRGFMQITGRANYRDMGSKIGVNLEENPDLVAEPLYALMTAAAFWDNRDLNKFADRNDLEGITKRINGGLNGLDHRKSNLDQAKRIFSQGAAAPQPRGSGLSLEPDAYIGKLLPVEDKDAAEETEAAHEDTSWMSAAYGGQTAMFVEPEPAQKTAVVPFRPPHGAPRPAARRNEHAPRVVPHPASLGVIGKVRDHGRLVLGFGVMFLLSAITIVASRYVLEATLVPGTPWEAIVLGFTGLVAIGSLGFIVLGWKIVSVRIDQRREPALAGRRDSAPDVEADAA